MKRPSMIKPFLTATLLTAICAASQAAWVADGKGDRFTVYLDPATVVKSGNTAKVWTLYDYSAMQTGADGQKYLSARIQTEIDCKESRLRLGELAYHAGRMGAGDVVASESNPSEWEPLSAENKTSGLWKLACGK
jgi:hypothetical protein